VGVGGSACIGLSGSEGEKKMRVCEKIWDRKKKTRKDRRERVTSAPKTIFKEKNGKTGGENDCTLRGLPGPGK